MTPKQAEAVLPFLRLTAAGEGGIITPAHAFELIPLVEAFAAGKTIQMRSKAGHKGWTDYKWVDISRPDFDSDTTEYRIKPESDK